jgi:hypothetical protein
MSAQSVISACCGREACKVPPARRRPGLRARVASFAPSGSSGLSRKRRHTICGQVMAVRGCNVSRLTVGVTGRLWRAPALDVGMTALDAEATTCADPRAGLRVRL